MPELPDITVYVEALARRVVGQPLVRVRLASPFVLRTAVPPIATAEGRRVTDVRRLGKRVVLALDGGLFLVLHLMVAGRLRWASPGDRLRGRITLAALDFAEGSVLFTEAGTKKRASLHLLADAAALAGMNPGGLEPLEVDAATFAKRLITENHTLKRALTDPRLFSGIGNAYSDEILHRARLSPLALTRKLAPEEIADLYHATVGVLTEWTSRLRAQAGDGLPENVTAFRPEMAVHGKFGKPCPVCGAPVQRIRYAENETNYCARCQTDGVVLADRALSRLLRRSWPRNIDELG